MFVSPLQERLLLLKKFTGDTVKKGDHIASLERKVPQATLDRELADFERVRADFEIFNQKNPNPTEEIDKYLKVEKQAALNASVKNVELAKAVLDQCDLYSPVDGVVMDDSSVVAGLNITPASSSFKIIDSSSYYVEVEIKEKDFEKFQKPCDVTVEVKGIGKTLKSQTSPILSDSKKFYIRVPISSDGLLIDLSAEIKS